MTAVGLERAFQMRLFDLGRGPGNCARHLHEELPGSPADFGKLIAEETEKWAKVIRAVNIKPE